MKFFIFLFALLYPYFAAGQGKEALDTANTQQKNVKHIYVVNGVVIDQDSLVNIDINEIESLSVIKDASQIGMDCITCPQTILIELKEPVEHTIQIVANGFESFIATQPPKEFYTRQLLRNKNILMVDEWNRRYENPTQYGSAYGMRIDYDPKQDYGLDIEYQLYMFFKFMEKENDISLL